MDNDIKTEFHVEVVKIGTVEKHPNADSLSITNLNGYPVIFRTGDFTEGSFAVYVPVDSLVPTDLHSFKFLAKEGKTHHRVKAVRLRGIFSMGLLVPLPVGTEEIAKVGQDMAEFLQVTKYIPPSELALENATSRTQHSKNAKKAGGLKLPVYSIDSMRKFGNTIQEDENVYVSEKIHGCNARFAFVNGRLWVGSHKVMRGCTRHRVMEFFGRIKLRIMDLLGQKHRADLFRDAGDVWWETAGQYNLKEKLAKKPGYVLYGEIYGEGVQDLTYDSPKGRKLRVFDVLDLKTMKFLDYDDFLKFVEEIGLDVWNDVVPYIYRGSWTKEAKEILLNFANGGHSYLNSKQIVEGVIVKPVRERTDPHIGRIILKYVGEGYLLRDDGKGNVSGKAASYKRQKAEGFPKGDRVVRSVEEAK